MIPTKPTIVELDMGKLDEILRRVEAQELQADDYGTIREVIESYVGLFYAVGDKNTTIGRLRKLLFGAKTEKTAAVVGRGQPQAGASPASGDSEVSGQAQPPSDSPKPRPNHGRRAADDYTGAEKVEVPHPSLRPGDPCPKCETGTVYETNRPGVVVRLAGQPPIGATVYYLQKLRCNLCSEVFTAALPEAAGSQKYDTTVGSMIALLKYGTGMPFHRAQKLQASLGIPLAASTQWEIVEAQAERAEAVFGELADQAAQGDVIHNDDTPAKILELMGQRARQAAPAEDGLPETEANVVDAGGPAAEEDAAKSEVSEERASKRSAAQRKGMFTSGIVATREGHRIALFFSGRKHAGENLADVLARRRAELSAPIQMCDALSRNLPKELATIVANCLAHARRQFVDVAESFPEECRHVLESLAVVYRNDATARQQNLSPEARLLWHQAESGPTMQELHAWIGEQFNQRRVEPNSGLGKAMSYLLRHWPELTLFLRVAGAPLDNNLCERALKRAILHRKNALFYKTRHGARVGDLFMSLIHTCELCGVNPFGYLIELDRHAAEASSNPGAWLPWNYQESLPLSPPAP